MTDIRFGDRADHRDDNFDEIRRFDIDGYHRFRTSAVQHIFDWWSSFDPRKPGRSDFELADHVAVAPHLFLIRVLGTAQFEYRLNGEAVVHLVGYSMKGAVFDTEDPAPGRRVLAEYYRSLIDAGVCKRCEGVVHFPDLPSQPFESVDCPLFEADGSVSHVLGALAPVEKDTDWDCGELSLLP